MLRYPNSHSSEDTDTFWPNPTQFYLLFFRPIPTQPTNYSTEYTVNNGRTSTPSHLSAFWRHMCTWYLTHSVSYSYDDTVTYDTHLLNKPIILPNTEVPMTHCYPTQLKTHAILDPLLPHSTSYSSGEQVAYDPHLSSQPIILLKTHWPMTYPYHTQLKTYAILDPLLSHCIPYSSDEKIAYDPRLPSQSIIILKTRWLIGPFLPRCTSYSPEGTSTHGPPLR